ncbi:MAG: DUF11 domain-containing protein, partial [Saprospiraceae bacterium]|nr:DUF11 domain-containing protein [Saprospiraceae bacterium]MBP7699155.1 DUF11 domain-containing protein [Saprospiraceae bacterium]
MAQVPIGICDTDTFTIAIPDSITFNADSVHWYKNSTEITGASISADKKTLTVTAADVTGIDTFKVSYSGPAPDVCTFWGCNVVFQPSCFDLALTKILSRAGPFVPGDTVTFQYTVINQGQIDAYNVGLTDYIPSGLTLNDGDWVLAGTNATYTLAGPLAAGSSA